MAESFIIQVAYSEADPHSKLNVDVHCLTCVWVHVYCVSLYHLCLGICVSVKCVCWRVYVSHCVCTCVSVWVNVLFTLLGEVTSHWFSRNAQRGMNSLSGHTEAHTDPETERHSTVQFYCQTHTFTHLTHFLWHRPEKTTKNVFSFSPTVQFFPLTSLLSVFNPLLSIKSHPSPNQESRLAWGWHESPTGSEGIFNLPLQMLVCCVFHG